MSRVWAETLSESSGCNMNTGQCIELLRKGSGIWDFGVWSNLARSKTNSRPTTAMAVSETGNFLPNMQHYWEGFKLHLLPDGCEPPGGVPPHDEGVHQPSRVSGLIECSAPAPSCTRPLLVPETPAVIDTDGTASSRPAREVFKGSGIRVEGYGALMGFSSKHPISTPSTLNPKL